MLKLIRWIAIYSADSVSQPSSNRVQVSSCQYGQYRKWKWINFLQVNAKYFTLVSDANSEKEGTGSSNVVAELDSRTALEGDRVLAASLDLNTVIF